MRLRTIVIDDTPLAVEKLEGFIRQVPLLEHASSFYNALDAIQFMRVNQVDLVFLDIQMEQFSGLQFLEALQTKPQIVIVSAYDQYAIHGFEHNVTDYLLKPYNMERFLKAVDKVLKFYQPQICKNYIFVKTGYKMERLDFSDILYVVSKGAYLQIVKRGNEKTMTLMSFEQLLFQLPSGNFQRVHRSFVVALDKIDSVERNIIYIEKARIPIGRNYLGDFYEKI